MSSEGRLRIDLPVIKRSGVNAATVKGALEQLCGIRYVMASPSTGHLLVFFDSRILTDTEIIERLNELNAFEPAIRWNFAGPRDVCRDIRDIAEILVRWMAVQRRHREARWARPYALLRKLDNLATAL